MFFGLQYIIEKHLKGAVVTREKVKEAKEFCRLHFNDDSIFPEEGWNRIIEVGYHDCECGFQIMKIIWILSSSEVLIHYLQHHGGHIPIRIRAVSEGSVVPVKNVLFTVENTDPKVPWIVGFVEVFIKQTFTIIPLLDR
mgnify:CR=1 FL=1